MKPEPEPPVNKHVTVLSYESGTTADYLLRGRIFNNPGIKYGAHGVWTPEGLTLEALEKEFSTIYSTHGDHSFFYLGSYRNSYLLIESHDREESGFEVYSTSQASADELLEKLRALFPPVKGDTTRTPVVFWSSGRDKPTRNKRKIEVPAWRDIEGNYSLDTRDKIARVMGRPPDGKVLVWHGPPGTGKTYAIRALIKEWERLGHESSYVVDPDQMLRNSPYLLHVLLEDVDNEYWRGGDPQETTAKRSRLMILEDAGELVSVDAKEKTGQGLSRLFNVTDGLIGQGFDMRVVITTNEELSRLHPALTRPGRCGSIIKFHPFAVEEANRWLAAHGSDVRVKRTTTLAELYGILNGESVTSSESVILGFGA